MNRWEFPFCPQPPDFVLKWDGLVERFDWLEAMSGCPQEPKFHAEGDVLAHVRMVCEALVSDTAWRKLESIERSVMFAAALMHDMAKPACTREDSGRITSPGHSRKGGQQAQAFLYRELEMPPPIRIRQEIVCLVQLHGLPLWLWDKPSPQKSVIESSLRVRNDMLGILAAADVEGRFCDDKQELRDRVRLFFEFCEENRCLTSSFSFPNNHSRFLYFHKGRDNPGYEAWDDTLCEVVMMCGLPGAGKDTWIKEQNLDLPVISLDEIRRQLGIDPAENQGPVTAHAQETARGLLRKKQGFIWNATNATRAVRRGLVTLFAAYGARVQIVYVESQWPCLLARNLARQNPVPVSVITKL
ncbi:MAG: AAA family ATPase, partial [Planctomycetota bacterium]|nr:AAA family ATPase [Planctomycetota bacterium]